MATNIPPLPEGFVLEGGAPPPPPGFVIQDQFAGQKVSARSPDDFFVNRGISRSLGGPVDLINEALGLIGLKSDNPVGGSKSIEGGLSALGANVPAPGEKPRTLLGNISQGIGDVGGGAAVAGPLLKATGIGANLIKGIAQAPTTAAVSEVASGVGSGTGGFIAEQEYPDNPAARAIGEISGGLSPSVLGKLVISGPTGMALRGLKKTIVPFTKGGATIRAEKRVQTVTGDRAAALRELSTDSALDLSPAQKSGDKGLLSLEASIRAKNAELDSQFEVRIDSAQEDATRQLIESGDILSPRRLIEARKSALNTLIEARVRQAALLAEKKIAELGVDVPEAQLSRTVKDEITSALEDARKQEKEFWSHVPQTVRIRPETTESVYKDILGGRNITDDPEDIPQFVRSFLGRSVTKNGQIKGGVFLKKEQPVAELQSLRSRILRERRDEAGKVAPSAKKISILDNIGDSLANDINVAAGDESFDIAREFSKQLNDKFRRGQVGKILGFEKTGGSRVQPEQALRSAIGGTGVSSEAGMRQLLNAVGDSRQARDQIGQFVMTRFGEKHVKDGVIVGNARGFLDRNEGMLREFPEMREKIENAIDAQILAQTREKTGATRQARLASRESDTQRFLDARYGDEVDTIFTSKNPVESARNIARTVRKDPEAKQGLRAAMAQNIIKRTRSPNVTEDGFDVLSSRKLAAFLKDERNKSVIDRVLGVDKRNRLIKIQKDLQKLENAQKAKSGKIINDVPNSILSTMARVAGAQVGRVIAGKTGGGTVQTPGIVSGGVQRFLGNITNDKAEALLIKAISDDSPEILNALLSNITNAGQRERAMRRIGAFIAGPSATMNEEQTQ